MNMQKSAKYAIVFVTLALVLAIQSLAFPQVAQAGKPKGDQIELRICYAQSVTLMGANQDNRTTSLKLPANPYDCFKIRTTNQYWRGSVKATAYFPSGEVVSSFSMPSTPRGGWVNLTFPNKNYDEIVGRSKKWVDTVMILDSSKKQGIYRQDTGGFVSYAWKLSKSVTLDALKDYADATSKEKLQAGDVINNQQSGSQGHAVMFIRWKDQSRNTFVAYEFNSRSKKAIEVILTLEKNSNNTWLIKEYSSLPNTWIFQRKKGL